MNDEKKDIILSMNHNEKIYCEYCDSECTGSSIAYGNQLLEDYNRELWFRWDFICLDCSENLCKQLDNDGDLFEFMHTNYLIHLGFEERNKTNHERS